MKLSKTSKIGIIVLICLTLLIWGINFLKGRDIFRTESVYFARYKNVGGLTATTLVTLNGLKIGYVRDIYFAEDLSGDLIVKIALHNKFPLPVGTSAQISSSDLLGSKVLKLNLGNSPKILQANDTLASKMDADIMQQVNEQLAPIKAKAERLIENLDSIVSAASKVLNNETQANISESFKKVHLTMDNLAQLSANLNEILKDQKKNINGTIANANAITGNLRDHSAKMGQMIDNLSVFSDSLKKMEVSQTVRHLNQTIKELSSILAKIDTANGSLGLLVNDPRLYQNLTYTSENLNRLLMDIRLNPKRYIHFSAIDIGGKHKGETNNPYPNQKNFTYRVQVFSSESPISLSSPLFKDLPELFELRLKGKFVYLTSEESSLEKIRMILNNIQSAFPEAFLRCYQNGKEITLKEATKLNKK